MNMGMAEEEYREKMDRLMRKSSHDSVSDEQLKADLAALEHARKFFSNEVNDRLIEYLRGLQELREALREALELCHGGRQNHKGVVEVLERALGGGSPTGDCLCCGHVLPLAVYRGDHPEFGVCFACRDASASLRGPCSTERGCSCKGGGS